MQDNQFKLKGFVVWGLCAIFFLYEFFLRIVMGTYQIPIMHDLYLTSFQFSLLSSTLFLIIYGIMQLPVGIIVDHIGLKKSLIFGTLACSLASIGFAYSSSYIIAMFYRGIMGFGASFGFICLLVAVHDWMPHRYNAIFIGLSQFIGTLGPMIATGPLDSLSENMSISWRQIFMMLGGIGIIMTILSFLFIENNNQKSGRYIILYKPEKISASILRLFTKIQPWYIAILSTTLYFTIEYLSENEGRNFLSLKGLSLNAAAYMLTTAWIGYAIGCPLLGFLSDYFKRRKIIMVISAIMGLFSIIAILYLPVQFLSIAFFVLGMSASGQCIGFAIMAEQFKKQFVAVGFGLNNTLIITISAINAPVIALLLDYKKSSTEVTLVEYLSVFNILVAISVVAVIISIFFIKETYCKSTADFTYLK